MKTDNVINDYKKIELSEFSDKANVYYQQLTKASKTKGLGSMEHIYFTYGIEWAFNRLSKKYNNYDSLLSALKDLVAEYEFIFENDFVATEKAKAAIKQAEEL